MKLIDFLTENKTPRIKKQSTLYSVRFRWNFFLIDNKSRLLIYQEYDAYGHIRGPGARKIGEGT